MLTECFTEINEVPCPLLEQQEAEHSDKTACPRAATKAQAEILTGYGSLQSPCFVTHLWFSVLWTQGSASPFKLTLL